MRSGVSYKEAEEFILSDHCRVESVANKGALFMGSGGGDSPQIKTLMKEGYILPEDTPGSRSVEQVIEIENFSFNQKQELRELVKQKFVSRTSGSLTVEVESIVDQKHFEQSILPIALANNNLTHINGIDLESERELYQRDLSVDKEQALSEIGRKILPDNDQKEVQRKYQIVEESIGKGVEKVYGQRLDKLAKISLRARSMRIQSFVDKNMLEVEKTLLGWKKRLPHNMVKLYLRREEMLKRFREASKLRRLAKKLNNDFVKQMGQEKTLQEVNSIARNELSWSVSDHIVPVKSRALAAKVIDENGYMIKPKIKKRLKRARNKASKRKSFGIEF